MAKARRKRQTYTSAKRVAILAAASKESLTALDVQKKFGVAPVTYYSWRRKYGKTTRRVAAGPRRAVAGLDLGSQVRGEVQAKVRQILPGIVRSEVSSYLNALFGSRRGRPRGV